MNNDILTLEKEITPTKTHISSGYTIGELKRLLNSLPSECDEATVRCSDSRRAIMAVELDIGPEWVLWVYTNSEVEEE